MGKLYPIYIYSYICIYRTRDIYVYIYTHTMYIKHTYIYCVCPQTCVFPNVAQNVCGFIPSIVVNMCRYTYVRRGDKLCMYTRIYTQLSIRCTGNMTLYK